MKIPFPEKEYYYLLHLYDIQNSAVVHTFLNSSELYETRVKDNEYLLEIIVSPDVFKLNQDILNSLKEILREKIRIVFNKNIIQINIYPNLNQFNFIANKYVPKLTPWGEINLDQEHLLKLLREAKVIIDYQNIGNASRSIIKKVVRIIFDPNKHVSSKEGVDLSDDKYKNRLHTYIRVELSQTQDSDIRKFALSMIDTCESAIDISSTLTHDLKATALMAESAVIGVMSILSIVRLIENKK